MEKSLLDLIFKDSPLARRIAASRPEMESIRTRPVITPGRPIRKRNNWLIPERVLKEIRTAEALDRISVPANVEGVILISPDVQKSTEVDTAHVGKALRLSKVESLDIFKTKGLSDVNLTVCLGETIGLQRCFPTTNADRCVWAQYRDRQGRIQVGHDGSKLYRRFVVERAPVDTDQITLVLRYLAGVLRVIAAYYGPESKKLPGTLGATKSDQLWWFDPSDDTGHALVITEHILHRIVKPVTQVSPW